MRHRLPAQFYLAAGALLLALLVLGATYAP